jgi:hypothetical protein
MSERATADNRLEQAEEVSIRKQMTFETNIMMKIYGPTSRGVPKGGFGFQPPPPTPPRNSEVLQKLIRIPSFVEYTSVTI